MLACQSILSITSDSRLLYRGIFSPCSPNLAATKLQEQKVIATTHSCLQCIWGIWKFSVYVCKAFFLAFPLCFFSHTRFLYSKEVLDPANFVCCLLGSSSTWTTNAWEGISLLTCSSPAWCAEKFLSLQYVKNFSLLSWCEKKQLSFALLSWEKCLSSHC